MIPIPTMTLIVTASVALAACAAPSTKHSAAASHHSAAAVATGASTVAAVPLVASGVALTVSGVALAESGSAALVAGHDLATFDPAPMQADGPPTLNGQVQ